MRDLTVEGTCVMCRKPWEVKVDMGDYFRYDIMGELAQNAFPYLNATERECLISDMCPACQVKLFGE